MSEHDLSTRLFSDSWHRVGPVHASLRTSVQAHRQVFHGEHWVVLRDTLSNDWYRISADAYRFISRLSLDQTVEEVWLQALEVDPDLALSQEEVVQLLGQLHLSNLLQFDNAAAAASLFQRYTKRKKRERLAFWMGFLSMRIPLIDPDRFLNRIRPQIKAVLSPWGLAVYVLLLLMAGLALIHRADGLFSQSAGVLAPGNLILLYVGFLIAKLVHELGHAAMCKHFGGEVHTIGVMLMMFAPLPYVDATASWGFRSRTERILVGLGGVLAELSVAAVAACIWAYTAPGILNALAYNVIFASSVSTVLFNLNPLMRFDGYHILVDFLNVPNLYQRSRDQLRYLAERFILSLPNAQPAARTRNEVLLLPLYGVLSLVYGLALMSTLIFLIAQQYLDLGVALAWFMAFGAVVMPLYKLVKYLSSNPQLGVYRTRSIVVSLGLVSTTLMFVGLMPMPDRVRVNGVVEAAQFRQLNSDAPGELAELMVEPGSHVRAGQLLLRLENPQLEFEAKSLEMQVAQLRAQELRATAMAMVDLAPAEQQRVAAEAQLAEMQRQLNALRVTAPIDGIWSAPDLEATRGRWVARGNSLGTVVGEGGWRFVAVLPQVASHIFENEVARAEIRLMGEEGRNIVATQTVVMPHEQGQLPSRESRHCCPKSWRMDQGWCMVVWG
jgi:putative peptide zinc metalloprotease protein